MKIRDILREFALDSGGDGGGDDGFSEETLKRLAAAWYNGDEDPRVEQTLMAAGWEIGQDEGYDDEPGVFVVQAGDVNGHSFISWPAHELRQGVAEGHADQQRKIFKRNGQPVGEVGIDRESSPGVGQWYVKHYASGKDLSGFDSFEEAAEELRHLAKQGVAEGPITEMNAYLWDKGYHEPYKRDPIKNPVRTFVEIARMFNITSRQLQGLTLNYPGFPAPVRAIGKAARSGKHNYYELNQVMQWIRDHDLSDRIKSYAKAAGDN